MAQLNLGLPDEFVEHGSHEDQLSWTGLTARNVVEQVRLSLGTDKQRRVSTLNPADPVELSHTRT